MSIFTPLLTKRRVKKSFAAVDANDVLALETLDIDPNTQRRAVLEGHTFDWSETLLSRAVRQDAFAVAQWLLVHNANPLGGDGISPDLVANNNMVHFQFYRKGELWYAVVCGDCHRRKSYGGCSSAAEGVCGFEFTVPIEDMGDGVFTASDKAMLFMRYIRKQLQAIEEGRQESLAMSEKM